MSQQISNSPLNKAENSEQEIALLERRRKNSLRKRLESVEKYDQIDQISNSDFDSDQDSSQTEHTAEFDNLKTKFGMIVWVQLNKDF